MKLNLKPKTIASILSWVAVGGVGLTGYLSARGAKKAAAKESKKGKVLAYAPAAAVGLGTCACIIGSNRVSAKEIAALTATCGYLAANRDKIEAVVKEHIGQEKLDDIKSTVVPKYNGQTIEETGKGDELFFDRYSGRWFRSSIDAVCYAEDEINERFKGCTSVCLNDFYELLGIELTGFGQQMGWAADEDWYEYTEGILFVNSYVAPSDHKADWIIDIETHPMECWEEI